MIFHALFISALTVLVGYLANRLYFKGGVCKSKKRLDGKVAIITGANTGIGFETALDFAYRGARVILACRDSKKAEKAAKYIIQLTNNKNIDFEFLDLSDLDTVRSFAEKMNKNLTRLDILVNNAGIMMCPNWRTKQDFRINWDDINSQKSYNPIIAYSQSKIANILFARELAIRYGGKGVLCFSLHPGAVRTELMRYTGEGLFRLFPFLMKLIYPIWLVLTKSSKEGAQTTIYLAVEENLSKYNGYYFSDCHPKKPSKFARSRENSAKLWDLSTKMLEKIQPLKETLKDSEVEGDDDCMISHGLPTLRQKSSILKEEHIIKLYPNLIPRAIGLDWILSFSTEVNGFNLPSLYRALAKVETPCLFVIMDSNKNIFGAMTVSKVYESKHKFYGTGESFLYTFFPKFKIFKWTRENNYFIRSHADGIAFGVSEHGLWFDGNLLHGHSQRCNTYNNDPLSSTENFSILSLEVWTFGDHS